MPEILGATNPVPGHDSAVTNRNLPVSPNNTQRQNIPDPSRVSGPDGRTEQQGSDLQGQAGGIRYDSNFQTFLQRLRENPGMARTLTELFASREGTLVVSGMSEGIAGEMAEILQMLHMDQGQQIGRASCRERV